MDRAYFQKRKETRQITSARKNKVISKDAIMHTINLQFPDDDYLQFPETFSRNIINKFPNNLQLSPPKYRNRINSGSVSARQRNNWIANQKNGDFMNNQIFETLGEPVKNRKVSKLSGSSLANESQLKNHNSQLLIPTFLREQFTFAKNDEILYPYQMKVFWKNQGKFVCLVNSSTSGFVNVIHPNIIKIYGKVSLNSKQAQSSPLQKRKEQSKEKVYLLVDIEMLNPIKGLLQQFGALDQTIVKTFLKKVILALKQLHEKGIYFHGLSSNKVFCSKKGKISISPLIQNPKKILTSLKFHMSKLTVGENSQSFSISGLSTLKEIDLNQKAYEGLIFYLAPQIFFSVRQNKKADTWAVGVLCLQLLLGSLQKIGQYHPYTIGFQQKKSKIFKYSPQQFQIIERINAQWKPLIQNKLKASVSSQLSKEAQKFIIYCLNIRQQQRPKIVDLLKHSFLKF